MILTRKVDALNAKTNRKKDSGGVTITQEKSEVWLERVAGNPSAQKILYTSVILCIAILGLIFDWGSTTFFLVEGLVVAAMLYTLPSDKWIQTALVVAVVVVTTIAVVPGLKDLFSALWTNTTTWTADVGGDAKEDAKKYAHEYRCRKKIKDDNDTLPCKSALTQAASVVSTPVAQQQVSRVITQHIHVEPGWEFQKVNIPQGKAINNFVSDCPKGCILEIVHDGYQLCPNQESYQGLLCGSTNPMVGPNGTTRYREQFAIPFGRFINLPNGLVVANVAVGTDSTFGPIDVDTKTTVSN